MKSRHLLLGLLLLPSLCLAELNAYQKAVVATFVAAGTDKSVAAAYEAANAGRATPEQRSAIQNAELIHEDVLLSTCVRSGVDKSLSIDEAVAKVVAAGQGAALIATTKSLFAAAEWQQGIPGKGTPGEQALAAVTMLAAGAHTGANIRGEEATRALRRRLALNYYMSYATDGKCKPGAQAKALLGRAP